MSNLVPSGNNEVEPYEDGNRPPVVIIGEVHDPAERRTPRRNETVIRENRGGMKWVVLLIVLVVIGAAAFFFLSNRGNDTSATATVTTNAQAAVIAQATSTPAIVATNTQVAATPTAVSTTNAQAAVNTQQAVIPATATDTAAVTSIADFEFMDASGNIRFAFSMNGNLTYFMPQGMEADGQAVTIVNGMNRVVRSNVTWRQGDYIDAGDTGNLFYGFILVDPASKTAVLYSAGPLDDIASLSCDNCEMVVGRVNFPTNSDYNTILTWLDNVPQNGWTAAGAVSLDGPANAIYLRW